MLTIIHVLDFYLGWAVSIKSRASHNGRKEIFGEHGVLDSKRAKRFAISYSPPQVLSQFGSRWNLSCHEDRKLRTACRGYG